MERLYDNFIKIDGNSQHYELDVFNSFVEQSDGDALKKNIENLELINSVEKKQSWFGAFSYFCDLYKERGLVLSKKNLASFYDFAKVDFYNGDDATKLSGTLETFLYVRCVVGGVNHSLLSSLVFTMKAAAVNYLEGRDYIASEMMNHVFSSVNFELNLYRRGYGDLLSVKNSYSKNGKKTKSPHRFYVEEIVRLTVAQYDNVSVSGLIEKIIHHISNDNGAFPPTDKTIRVWIKNLGYKPVAPFMDKRKYELVLPKA